MVSGLAPTGIMLNVIDVMQARINVNAVVVLNFNYYELLGLKILEKTFAYNNSVTLFH